MTPDAPEDRAELEALLPFHVNDTLDPKARARIDAWLAADAEAAGEAAALAQVRLGLQAEPVQSPAQTGLARLMRSLDAETGQPDSPAGSAGNAAAGMPQPANLPSKPVLWQAVAAIALAALIGQNLLSWGSSDAVSEARFGLTGTVDGLAGGAAPATAITLRFAPGAAEAEIRALLLDLGGQIVAGPTAAGQYLITADDPASALSVLRAATALVDSAEPATD